MKKRWIPLTLAVCLIFGISALFGCGKKGEPIDESKFLFVAVDGGVSVVGYTGDKREVTLPSSHEGEKVVVVAAHAFENADLDKIVLPTSLDKGNGQTAIGEDAFSNMSENTLIVYLGTRAEWIDKVAPLMESFVGYDSFVQCSDGVWWATTTPIG